MGNGLSARSSLEQGVGKKMERYAEEEFFKKDGWPTEELLYCSYWFCLSTSVDDRYCDYDQFALVVNAEYPYIRLTKKRGSGHIPCGGISQMATDGMFASKTDEEREDMCPKIAWGLAAYMLAKLHYDNNQQDFVLPQKIEDVFCKYYDDYLKRYLDSHNALKYSLISDEQKEIDFIDEHFPVIKSYWSKSGPLKKYEVLYCYCESFEMQYEEFLRNRKQRLLNKIMVRNDNFSTEIREPFEDKPCIKVFFLQDEDATKAKTVIEALNCINNVNITISQSKSHPGKTLTVYPKPMVSAEVCEKDIQEILTRFYSREVVGNMQVHNEAKFKEIESKILSYLDEALASIDVCVAWFTNEKLCNKLIEKQSHGIAVRVIIYKDGVNHAHGVDLSALPHKELRGERGGLMHDKFCVIDNVHVVSGSYNWTLNAENKNDEDATFHKEDYKFASTFTKQFNEMWNRE